MYAVRYYDPNPYDGNLGIWVPEDFDDNGSGGGINWMQIINQGFGIASQAIGAWGNNPTYQQQAGGQALPYSAAVQIAQAQAQAQQALYGNPRYQQQLTGTGGVGLDDAASSITGFITRNPLLVAGGALGLYLLMREPPRRR